MISEQLVDLSRLQFAATAMYQFLFVPLALGPLAALSLMTVGTLLLNYDALR
ncbi:MAG: hypothetical protein ACOY5V_13835 [Pseudomonadota bacterium]